MEILEGLDQPQLAAATSEAGRTLITAGAGTGKTRTLTARIAWLITQKAIPAGSIVAVTFTNKAAQEIRERVKENIGDRASGLRIGTFHGLAARLLRSYPQQCGLQDKAFTICDEEDQRQLMALAAQKAVFGTFKPAEGMSEDVAKAAEKDHLAAIGDFVGPALRQVSLWKSWGLSVDESLAPPPGLGDEAGRLIMAYQQYQEELESRNMVDFGDLLLKSVLLMRKNPDIAASEAGRVRHMLIDEAQDANQVQIEWVQRLTMIHQSLTVVGDEDQNIYGFQGGFAGAMAKMAGSNAQHFELKTNRRCTDDILRPANQIVDYNRRKTRKVLNSGRKGLPVKATAHVNDANEAAWTAGRIAELIEEGAEPSQIAILTRSGYVMKPFEEALARKGVQSFVTSGAALLAREEIRDMLSFARLAQNPMDDLAFVRIANKPVRGLGSIAIEAIVLSSHRHGMPLYEACEHAAEEGTEISLSKKGIAGARALGKALLSLHEDSRWGRHSQDVLTTALATTGYETWLKKQGDAESRLDNIDALFRMADSRADLGEFLIDMSLLSDGDEGKDRHQGKVRISTMHASKGLEFDHVFCPGFDDGVTPSGRAMEEGGRGKPGDVWNGPQGGGVEEERRLVHVAFTRARHSLNVSFPWKRSGKRGKMIQGGPSSFIEECEFVCEEIAPVGSAELGRRKTAKSRSGRVGFERE